VEEFRSTITPVLTVRDAAQAVVFYGRAFGAEEIYRNTYPDGTIVAELAVEGARFRVADEAPEASNLSPETLNGTTVRSICWSPILTSSPRGRSRTGPWRSLRSSTSHTGCARGGSPIHSVTTG
jgi:hypothetical protein